MSFKGQLFVRDCNVLSALTNYYYNRESIKRYFSVQPICHNFFIYATFYVMTVIFLESQNDLSTPEAVDFTC